MNVGYVGDNGEDEIIGSGGSDASADARVNGESKPSKILEPGSTDDRRVSV